MFKKIVSGLPFSPSMVAQLGSYSKQLEKERRLRLLGLVFAVIITTVQLTYLFTFSFFNLSLSKESVVFQVYEPLFEHIKNIHNLLPSATLSINVTFFGILILISIYMYFRCRQINEEIRLIRKNLNSGAL